MIRKIPGYFRINWKPEYFRFTELKPKISGILFRKFPERKFEISFRKVMEQCSGITLETYQTYVKEKTSK